MSVTSHRTITISFTGDLVGEEFPFGCVNLSSPVQQGLASLVSGNNTLTVPTDAVGLTIVPPVSNVSTLKLKGLAGDTGVTLHLTHPTSIAFDTGATIILHASVDVDGVRLIWT